ncbi:MAG: hypothetical protein L0206_05845 [Actinobacteria bacterium]|nr:hypothetical protein [Actinomycetota bacterium]
MDVRHVLSAVRVPTLVLVRKDDPDNAEAEEVATRIPNATYVELPGRDYLFLRAEPGLAPRRSGALRQ